MAGRRDSGREAAPLPAKESPPPPYDSDEEDEEAAGEDVQYRPFLLRYITALSRTMGVILVCLLWLFTGILLQHLSENKYSPWYLLGVSILVTFFETIWMFNKCVVSCMRQEGCCCTFWRFLVWIDTWRKTILYVAFAIPCFIQDIVNVETIVSGLLLIVTAGFYFTKSFKDSTCTTRKRVKHAVVQTPSPKASLVAHGVQVGKTRQPPNYHATHTLPEAVQPQERQTVSRSRRGSGSSEGSRSSGFLDPSGKKQQRYTPAAEDGEPERSERDRYDDRRDRYDDRDSRRDRNRDRYEERDRDRYDDRDRDRDRDRYDRDRDRRDRSEDRDSDRRSDRRGERDRDRRYSDEESEPRRGGGYDGRDRYRKEGDRSPPERPRSAGDGRKPKPSRPSPPSSRRTPPPSSKRTPPEAQTPGAPPIKTSPEPPPLKELPAQASEDMKKSAAASLVKQVSSGSIVLTSVGSTPSGLPTKVERKAADMKYEGESQSKSTNPFDEPDEDEYFD